MTAETDANGRYQLAGLGRLRPLLVSFGQGDKTGLLSRTIAVTAQNDESVKTLDVLLKRGIVVSGRVIDSFTGKGVSAGIRYVPLPANDFVKQPGYDAFERDGTMRSVDAEGTFRIRRPARAGRHHGAGPRGTSRYRGDEALGLSAGQFQRSRQSAR